MQLNTIGILGGTFDPIHNGHLHIAFEIYSALSLKELRLIPSAQSPLREPPIATAVQRYTMAQLATQHYSWIHVDDREIKRGGVSYTVDTLVSLRQEMPDTSLCFMMSTDQFLQFDQWRSSGKILELVHLVITNRPGYSYVFNSAVQAFIDRCATNNIQHLHDTRAGFIFFQEVSPVSISGTQIRAKLKAGERVGNDVPKEVLEYINRETLYRG